MNISQLWWRSIKSLLIITPLALLSLSVLLPVVDFVSPWNVAESKLKSAHPDSLTLCVGISRSSGEEKVVDQRIYLLVKKGQLTSITETVKNQHSTITVTTSQRGFWSLILFYLSLIFLSVRFSIPKIRAKLKKRDESIEEIA